MQEQSSFKLCSRDIFSVPYVSSGHLPFQWAVLFQGLMDTADKVHVPPGFPWKDLPRSELLLSARRAVSSKDLMLLGI